MSFVIFCHRQKKRGSPLKAEDYVTQIILSVVEAARSKVNILYERRTCEVCMYDDIADETGYDKQALRDIKYVAQNVESSRRNDNLSFTHHREVASLPSGSTRSTRTERQDIGPVIQKLRYQMRTLKCPSPRRRAQQKSRVARHVLPAWSNP